MVNLILAVLFFLPLGFAHTQNSKVELETMIPEGMPIKLEVLCDKTESSIAKYTVNRVLLDKVKGAKFLIVMIGVDGKVAPTEGSVLRFASHHLADPMTVATADPSVSKMLVMVEGVETASGKWVVDTSDENIPIEAIIEHGIKALPKAKFIKH